MIHLCPKIKNLFCFYIDCPLRNQCKPEKWQNWEKVFGEKTK